MATEPIIVVREGNSLEIEIQLQGGAVNADPQVTHKSRRRIEISWNCDYNDDGRNYATTASGNKSRTIGR